MTHPAPSGIPGPRPRRWLAIGLVLLLGVALRTVQYCGFVPLWHDEAALGRNLDERSLRELVSRPLDHRQMAPSGWMAVLELASHLPGRIEAALRLPPFLISLAALALFWRVARRLLSGAALGGALVLFAISPAMVWYATSVKQYGADVAASLFLVWLALRHRERPDDTRRALGAAIGGGMATLVSFPAVAVAALLGLVLLIEQIRRQRPWRPFASLATGWAAGALVATAAALRMRSADTNEFMESFWAEGFLPWREPLRALIWLPERIASTFAHFLIFEPPRDPLSIVIVAFPLVFALAGVVLLWRRRESAALALLVPTLAATVLGAAHVLPFRHRVAVYAMWPILIVGFFGVQALIDRYPKRRWLRALAFLPAVPLALAIAALSPPPYRGQATRPVLEALQSRLAPGDVLYVTCGGRHAIAFYGPRVGIASWTQGSCAPTALLNSEVDRYAGAPRVWLFFTQSHGEAEALRERLGSHGAVVEEVKDPWKQRGELATGAVLFDLSEKASGSTAL